jgi:hypothetical protein
MDRDVIIGGTITGVVFSAILLCGSCSCIQNYQDDNAMVAMVQHGSSPVGARCAIKNSSDGVCALAAR